MEESMKDRLPAHFNMDENGKDNRHFFWSVTDNMVLVKNNLFTRGQTIKPVGKYKVTIDKDSVELIRIHDSSVSTDFLRRVAAMRGLNERSRQLIEAELAWRSGIGEETEALKSATIKVKGRDRYIERFFAKHGIHIVWPWQEGMILPLAERTLNTPEIVIKEAQMIIDVDYQYRIVKPEIFAGRMNSITSEGVNRGDLVEQRIAYELDTAVRQFIKDRGITYHKDLNLRELLDDVRDSLFERMRDNYGVEITNILVQKVTKPEALVKADEAVEVAEKEAEAVRRRAEGDADATRKKAAADAEARRLINQAYAEGEGALLRELMEVVSKDPNFADLPAEAKMRHIAELYRAKYSSGKHVFIEGAGEISPSFLTNAVAANETRTDSKPGSLAPVDDDKALVKEILDGLGIVDEDCLTRSASRYIAEYRSVELTPGQVYTIDEISLDEAKALAKKYAPQKEHTEV